MRKYCFPYRQEFSEIFGRVLRPVVPLSLKTRNGEWHQIFLYADSGADITLFPRRVAQEIGIPLRGGQKGRIGGVGGERLQVYIRSIPVRIGDEEFQIRAAFAERDDVPYLLGRADILDRFAITFEKDCVCFTLAST